MICLVLPNCFWRSGVYSVYWNARENMITGSSLSLFCIGRVGTSLEASAVLWIWNWSLILFCSKGFENILLGVYIAALSSCFTPELRGNCSCLLFTDPSHGLQQNNERYTSIILERNPVKINWDVFQLLFHSFNI